MTADSPTNASGLTGADMLALVAHITGLLSEMEGRIMDRLSDNASGAEERWRKHDAASERTIGAIREEIGVLRADFSAHLAVANAHFGKEHDEEIAGQARTKPIRTVATIVVANWKSIALAIFALMGILGWAGLETHVVGS
jgi:hypothetical protein